MKKIYSLTFLVLISISSIAQGSWTQKTSFGGAARGYLPAGFSIGTKAYVGIGYNSSTYYNDFWEWDQTTNTWMQRANFIGSARIAVVSFAINGKGYVGTGQFVSTNYNTFYEYDPGTNIWTAKANFPGTVRCYGVGFSIGNKGYIGSGGSGSSTSLQYADFYEYNPANNTWTAKANFATMGRTGAIGVSCGDKGYIGLGWKFTGSYQQDFWEYDTTLNTWTQRANFIGSARTVSTAFSIGNKVYVGMGYNGSSEQQNFYEWDQATNTWSVKANFGGGNRASMQRGLSIGGKGYAGLGYNGTSYFTDWWEYNPLNVLTTSTSITNVSCNGQCDGTATAIPSGGLPSYTYLWSDGQTTATATGLCAGPYSVTVTDANLDVVIANVTITEPSVLNAIVTTTMQIICDGVCTGLTLNATGGTPSYSYLWMPNAVTTPTTNVCPTANETYTCTVTDANGCANTQTITITVNPLPTVAYVESQTLVCINWNPITLSAGSPVGGIYSGSGVTGNQFDPLAATVGTWNVVYTYADVNGCSDSVTQQITVDLCLGVSNPVSFSDVEVFPNPFSNMITVQCGAATINGELTIYNVLGAEVYNSTITHQKMEIDLEGLTSGVYFIRIDDNNGTSMKKIVKQ